MAVKRSWLALATLVLAAVVAGWLLTRPTKLPDFDAIEDVRARKTAFFSYLAPLVEAENDRIADQRSRLLELADELDEGQTPGWLQQRWLRRLAVAYEVEGEDEPGGLIETLKRRVDTIPVPLVLVQAAKESGWGRSRYAVRGNNLFGQWCYASGCGFVPRRRAPGAFHEVARFDSPADAVASYMENLNTHPAYVPLREIRASLRRGGSKPTALELADGLLLYSERRGDYVKEVKSMIRVNRELIAESRPD